MFRTVAAIAASLLALSGSAGAQVFYVDAVQGDDTNDGSSPGTAFRTITRASLAAQSGNSLSQIQVAAGVYDASIGEVFPIVLSERHGVFGPDAATSGAAAVVVPGIGADGFHVTDPDAFPQMRRLTVQDADRAFVIEGSADMRQIDVRRCRIAFDLSADVLGAALILTSSVSDCDFGVLARRSGVQISSTTIEGALIGVRYTPDHIPNGIGGVALGSSTIRSCRVGLEVESATSDAIVNLINSALVECATGVRVPPSSTGSPRFQVTQSTFARNGVGLSIGRALSPASSIEKSIVAANGLGFATSGFIPPVTNSIVDDGSATGVGVLAVDPLFVDAANGDYRLQRTSPAVDRILVPAQFEAFEPDGDLDSAGGSDWGAFERLTLTPLSNAPVGGSLTFQSEGEPGSYGIGLLDRTPYDGQATLTPFGGLLLTGPDIERVALFRFPAQSPYATWSLSIPNDPALEGRTWLAQSLVRTSASPSGGAFSNAVPFRIE